MTAAMEQGISVRRDEAHRYWLPDGREALGVSAILKAAGLIDDRWFNEEAALRGTFVHAALEYLDAGELVEDSVDPAIAGYVAAYQRFLRECPSVGRIVLSEAALGDLVLGYAGTVDRVRYVGDALAVIDFKTGAPCSWHPIQLSAYAALVKTYSQHAIVQRWGLYLRADGGYTFKQYTDRRDWDVFRAALLIATYKRGQR